MWMLTKVAQIEQLHTGTISYGTTMMRKTHPANSVIDPTQSGQVAASFDFCYSYAFQKSQYIKIA